GHREQRPRRHRRTVTTPGERQRARSREKGPEDGAHAEPVTITPVRIGPDHAGARGIIPACESPADPMARDTIVILDFGSQYTQLIARRLRELQVYSEIVPPTTSVAALKARAPRGIVLSGGPDSVYEKGAPRVD